MTAGKCAFCLNLVEDVHSLFECACMCVFCGVVVACSFRCVWDYVLLILVAVLCTSVWGFAVMIFMVGADECFAV